MAGADVTVVAASPPVPSCPRPLLAQPSVRTLYDESVPNWGRQLG